MPAVVVSFLVIVKLCRPRTSIIKSISRHLWCHVTGHILDDEQFNWFCNWQNIKVQSPSVWNRGPFLLYHDFGRRHESWYIKNTFGHRCSCSRYTCLLCFVCLRPLYWVPAKCLSQNFLLYQCLCVFFLFLLIAFLNC